MDLKEQSKSFMDPHTNGNRFTPNLTIAQSHDLIRFGSLWSRFDAIRFKFKFKYIIVVNRNSINHSVHNS